MFISSEILTLIGLLLIAIVISLINIGSVVPYAKANNYYRYEGFREGVADTTTTASSSSPSSGSSTTPVSASSATTPTTASNPAPSSSPSTVSTEGTYVGADDLTMIIKNANSIITAINNAKTSETQNTTTSSTASATTPATTSTSTKVESMIGGMNTISPAPAYSDSILDTYSLDEGSIMCGASPYSNSHGYICMTDQQKQLLMTRGGNQTYRGDTYGTP